MRFAVYLLVLLAALTLFAGIDRPAISDSDEAFYAEAGREMVASGDWLTPRFNYQDRFQKPILYYWVVSASYTAAGVSEAAARFGSALAGLGIVLITFACGRRWYDERVGLLAGTVVATSFGTASAARLSLPDLPLAFFITLATWSAFVALFDRPPRPRRWWLLAGLAAGLGFLTKGPVAVAIPALVLLLPVVLERGWRRVRPADLVLAAVVFIVVGLPWYVAMTAAHGTSYLRGFFIGDNLERFATTAFNPHRPVYFYVPIILGGMLPWSPFFALAIRPAWRAFEQRQRPSRPDIRALWWALLPFLLFTASVGKQPRYILPMLGPLGLLIALAIRRAATTPPPLPGSQRGLFRWMAALSGGLIVVLAVLLWRARPLLVDQPAAQVFVGIAALTIVGAAVVVLAASRHWRYSPVAVALAGAVLVLVMRFSIVAVPGLDPVEQVAANVVAQRSAGEPVASYRVFVRNLVFYTHVQQPNVWADENVLEYLDRPDRVLCVLLLEDLERFEARWREEGRDEGPRLRRLYSVTYFDAATAKARSVLWPDPKRDFKTAVLVANR